MHFVLPRLRRALAASLGCEAVTSRTQAMIIGDPWMTP